MQFLMERAAAAGIDRRSLRNAGIVLALATVMTVGFAQLRVPGGGDDWHSFSEAARRMVGIVPQPVYGPGLTTGTYYVYNPPWVIIVGLPILLLPYPWGWAVGCTATLFVGILLLRRWLPAPGIWKVGLLLLSPPMIYILLHGQIDVLLLGGLLLPVETWWLVALTKPQNTIGLAFGVPRGKWLRAGLILAGVVLLTLILLGNWPLAIMQQPSGFFMTVNYNLWQGLWPFQLAVGVGLLAVGTVRRDERFLVSASPFFSPYVTMSSMIGPWLAALTGLSEWQALLVFAAWWGAVIYRLLGGASL